MLVICRRRKYGAGRPQVPDILGIADCTGRTQATGAWWRWRQTHPHDQAAAPSSPQKVDPVTFRSVRAPSSSWAPFLLSDRLHRYAATLCRAAPESVRRPATPTPTHNVRLPFRRGGFASLCEALDYAAEGETGLNFFDARGKLLSSLPYGLLRAQAQAFARRLIGGGIARGERLLIVADTWPGFCVAFFGAQYAGILPVPVAVPVGLGAKASYIEQVKRSIVACGAIGILAPDELAAYVATAAEGTSARLAGSMSTFEAALPEVDVALRPLSAGERCYVQFSSGSTREPLGIDIHQDRLMANIDGSIGAQELNEHDSGVSWLPLYHDMGLIGFVLAPMCGQRSVDLLAPGDFARRPLQWLSLISRRRATITYSPSFGYELVARRAQTKMPADLDLSCLKLAGIGADMIQPPVLERFAATFAAAGLRRARFPAELWHGRTLRRAELWPPLRGLQGRPHDRRAVVDAA